MGLLPLDALQNQVSTRTGQLQLGVQQNVGQSLRESLLSFLRNKQLLMVLDNCEHLLDVVAELVNDMTKRAADLSVLATSREPLRVAGEQVVAVPSLALPHESSPVESLVSSDAVRLFVDRARSGRPAFSLGTDNAGAIAHLCRRLDGVPLAIELAAARARSMAPDEIAARLDQRFRLLTGGTRSAANRHQTLRRAIDWSYDLLEEDEKLLFSRLSVCVGGFDLDAAEAIGSGGTIDKIDADDLLGRLVDKSLISAYDLGNATRYRMLETIREYALERLEASGEIADVRTRHADHFTRFAIEAGTGLKGRTERLWLDRVEEDLDNLRAAVTWSLDSGAPDTALRCVLALGLQGLRFQPTVSAWARAVVSMPAAQSHPAYSASLAVVAWSTANAGRPEEAHRQAEAALQALGGEGADPEVVCRVASPVAGINPMLGHTPGSEVTRWLEAARALGDSYETALALTMMAVSQQMTDRYTEAVVTAEQAVEEARRNGSPTAIAYATFNLANYIAERDPEGATALNTESLRCAEAAGNEWAASLARGAQGNVLLRVGDHASALAAWVDSARRAARDGRRDLEALGLLAVSACLAARGDLAAAAVVRGWVEDVIGSQINLTGNINVTDEMREPYLRLPQSLGERYPSLLEQGSVLDEFEILEYVAAQIPVQRASETQEVRPSPE